MGQRVRGNQIRSFAQRLRNQANEFSRLGVSVSGAQLCDQIAVELESLVDAEDQEVITIQQGAGESGYSEEHLRRLIREGKIPNAGRPGSPRLFARDLPRRPRSSVAERTVENYDVVADARGLRSRREGGANGNS